MANIKGFTKRFTGNIRWSGDDIDRLREIYGLTEKQAATIVQKHLAMLAMQPLPPVSKSAAADMPARWRFTASDGKVDRVGDIVNVEGIDLKEYRLNPIWHHMHDFNQPIGRSANIEKINGKLESVLELGVDCFPMAASVQKMLNAKMVNSCSIGFTPVVWKYVEERDGIDFHSIKLFEISTVTVPCCVGAVCHGPVKSLKQEAADMRKLAEEDRAYLAEAAKTKALEDRIASSTPEQRKRRREMDLIRMRAKSW